jgi:hypothetical protein
MHGQNGSPFASTPLRLTGKELNKIKGIFSNHFRKEWDMALAKMESIQPLLALCVAHWKAKHILGNALLVKVTVDLGRDGSDSTAEDNNKSPPKNGAAKVIQVRRRTRICWGH